MEACPTFSIITVTWRDLTGLRATAASVKTQTDRDFEWVVIDGASDDGTPEWLAALTDDTLVWVSEKDGGIFDAMNKGLERARGRYVLFLNAGDTLHGPDVLARVHTMITASSPDLVYGDSMDVQADGTRLYRPARWPNWIRFGMFTSHQAMFYRRDHAPGLRYDLRFSCSGDYAFTAAFLSTPGPNGKSSCEHFPSPICDFTLGGHHFIARRRGMREDFLIRRDLLKQSWWLAKSLHFLHEAHHSMKLLFPSATQKLRYRSRSTTASGR